MRKQVTAALALILGLCCLLVGCTPPEEQKIEIGRPQNVQQAGEVPVDLTGEDAEFSENFGVASLEDLGLTYECENGGELDPVMELSDNALNYSYRVGVIEFMSGIRISGFDVGQNNLLEVELVFSMETNFPGDIFLILNGKGPQFNPDACLDPETGDYTVTYTFQSVPSGSDNRLGLIANDADSANTSFSFRFKTIRLKASRLETTSGGVTDFKEGGDRYFDDFSSLKAGVTYSTEYGQSTLGYADGVLDGLCLMYAYPNSLYGLRPSLIIGGLTFAPYVKYVVKCDLKITSSYVPDSFAYTLQASPDITGSVSLATCKQVDGVYKIRVEIVNDSALNRRMIVNFPYAGETDAVECYIDNLEIIAIEQIYVG